MAGISPKTRFNRAKKMSLEKWEKCAEITEEEFRNGEEFLGLSSYKCGFCTDYFKLGASACGQCPLHDEKKNCCKEFAAASIAFACLDYPAYHAAAIALRDRIEGMEYEEES